MSAGVQAGGSSAAAARSTLPSGRDGEDLKAAPLRFVADSANRDLAAHSGYPRLSRALAKAARGRGGAAGGGSVRWDGSIPLEAPRPGRGAFESDPDPAACLILRAMLEDIPRRGPAPAEDLREAGAELRDKAARELADLHPADADGAVPIMRPWARGASRGGASWVGKAREDEEDGIAGAEGRPVRAEAHRETPNSSSAP